MFLAHPPRSDDTESAYAVDRAEEGYVHNYTRLWSWRPGLWDAFGKLREELMGASALSDRDWAVLLAGTVAQLGDSYCSLAWAPRLAERLGAEASAQLLAGRPAPALSERETALAEWARQVVRDPNATSGGDVARLREAGLDDREIFEATAFVAFRLALSTINDALGAQPDAQMAGEAAPEIRDVVTYGRPPSQQPSPA